MPAPPCTAQEAKPQNAAATIAAQYKPAARCAAVGWPCLGVVGTLPVLARLRFHLLVMTSLFPLAVARRWLRLGAVVGAFFTWCGAAQADAYSDVATLIRTGDTAQALAQAQQYLSSNPRDPQMRFLQGSAQSKAGDTAAAVQTFTQLTEEYPELPEPYNNLAVIYASQGQLEQARHALNQAVRNNPAYAVAYENLGDVYLRLAREAYTQSSKLQGAKPALQRKLHDLQPLLQPSQP